MPKKGYQPVDSQSDAARQKRRYVRLALVAVVAFIVVFGLHLRKQLFLENTTDDVFSALLVDDRAFYFPTTVGTPPRRRRNLQDQSYPQPYPGAGFGTIVWSFDWKQDIGASAAIGEYYRSKAMALAALYSSSHGKNTTANETSTLTTDWRHDKTRGIQISEHYKAIGDAIDEHYKRIYNKQDPKELMSYDWQGDRDRGLTIGKYYHLLGKTIGKHYLKAPKYRAVAAQSDWQWEAYVEKGEEIASYYHNKSVAVKNYYKGRFADMWNSWDTRGELGAFALREEMKEKGMAISEYYRAKYDPKYKPDKTAKKDDFPPWGQDPEADRAHGQAIGQFYEKHGKDIGQFYKQQGKEIGKYYQHYYTTLFDPTYGTASP